MLPLSEPDRIRIAFHDHRLVSNAGLLLRVTLAQRLCLRELVGKHVDLGDAPGRANTGDKMLTLVASALAGGDCIDDADVLRSGGTAGAIGCVVKAPSTLGTFLRSFRWGHVRQLDRVSRELLARAWAAGAGPGDGPLTIDLDSTICETYGLAKEGAPPPRLHRPAGLSPAACRTTRHCGATGAWMATAAAKEVYKLRKQHGRGAVRDFLKEQRAGRRCAACRGLGQRGGRVERIGRQRLQPENPLASVALPRLLPRSWMSRMSLITAPRASSRFLNRVDDTCPSSLLEAYTRSQASHG